MSVETVLLETQLKELGLTTFVRNHATFAADAAQAQASYAQYLLTLAEQEVKQRAANSADSKKPSSRLSNNWLILTLGRYRP